MPDQATHAPANASNPAPRAGLPDPRRFDPVAFPGAEPGEAWPPTHFNFHAPWMHEPGLGFERDASGGIAVVRSFAHLRLLVDIDTAHQLFDLAPGSRDFRLLRLIPAALRCVDRILPGDPMPGPLLDEEEVPEEHHLYAATTAMVERLASQAGEEGQALAEAMRRVPPGPGMFEAAVARCITRFGFPMATVAPLARRLQRLANAHARVLATAAAQPDYAAMEKVVLRTRQTLGADRGWVGGGLLTRAMDGLLPQINRPRRASAAILAAAEEAMRRPLPLEAPTRLILEQDGYRDRLLDISVFWRRLSAAWMTVDPDTTDRREIEALARNTLRRLSLTSLYRPPDEP